MHKLAGFGWMPTRYQRGMDKRRRGLTRASSNVIRSTHLRLPRRKALLHVSSRIYHEAGRVEHAGDAEHRGVGEHGEVTQQAQRKEQRHGNGGQEVVALGQPEASQGI